MSNLRSAVITVYGLLAATALAALSPLIAERFAFSYSAPMRALGVAIAVLSWVPVVVIVGWMIKRSDEFERRMHLLALGLAFAAAVVMLELVEWLSVARFIEMPPMRVLILAMLLQWLLCMLIAKRYYQRQA